MHACPQLTISLTHEFFREILGRMSLMFRHFRLSLSHSQRSLHQPAPERRREPSVSQPFLALCTICQTQQVAWGHPLSFPFGPVAIHVSVKILRLTQDTR